jgi:signal peptidase I
MNTAPQSRNSLKLALVADTLRQFSRVKFVAHGTSMLPAIYPGDCLTVESFAATAPRCGDIVLCRRAGEFRVHRIVAILEEKPATFYVLRGDALTDDDPPVPAEELLGRVASLERRGKSLDLNSGDGIRRRLLRSLVRHSKVATVLLLRWHAMQTRDSLYSESLLAVSAEARTERT